MLYTIAVQYKKYIMDNNYKMESSDHIKMKIIIKEPEWIRLSYAPKLIDEKWGYDDLMKYILEKEKMTEEQFNRTRNIHYKIKERTIYELSDYDLDDYLISMPFVKYLKELHEFEEAQFFYYEQWLDYETERIEKERANTVSNKDDNDWGL